MTDEQKALIERLREPADWAIERPLTELRDQAADTIEALATQNEGYNLALAEQLQIRQQLETELDRCRAASVVADNTIEAQAREIERLEMQLIVESEPSPYCPICGSCGEEGCCGSKRCLYPDTGLSEKIEEQADEIKRLTAKLEKMQRGRDRYREEYYEARKTFRDTQP